MKKVENYQKPMMLIIEIEHIVPICASDQEFSTSLEDWEEEDGII